MTFFTHNLVISKSKKKNNVDQENKVTKKMKIK